MYDHRSRMTRQPQGLPLAVVLFIAWPWVTWPVIYYISHVDNTHRMLNHDSEKNASTLANLYLCVAFEFAGCYLDASLVGTGYTNEYCYSASYEPDVRSLQTIL